MTQRTNTAFLKTVQRWRKRSTPTLLLTCCLPLLACSEPAAPPAAVTPTVEVLSQGLHHPWSLAFLADGSLLISERRGTLQHFNPANATLHPVLGVPPVAAGGQGGLFDVRLHPKDSSLIYLVYAKHCTSSERTVAISRARWQQQQLVELKEIFVANACGSKGQHFGGRIAFDNHGHLYLGIGDRGERERAENPADHAGTVLRLKDDGSIPADNPFVGDSPFDDAIFSYGPRTPQGMIFHPPHQESWLHEHGPRGGDENNRLLAGSNYGWPAVTYGREYFGPKIGVTEKDGTEPPLKPWTLPSPIPVSLITKVMLSLTGKIVCWWGLWRGSM